MGVYLPKMDMPLSCWECKFCIYNDYTCLPHSCVIKMSVFDHFDIANGKPSWCPLVEVPPHGDLIDKDELIPVLAAWIVSEDDFQAVLDSVERISTVIESEG